MINAEDLLSYSLQNIKGVYALLLGSGISRTANIPTGWEVTLDLIGKLAIAQGETASPDPAAWYRTKFGKEPDYSELLNALSPSPEERQRSLYAYFEPTDEERAKGDKVPTAAHRAIAKLVKNGVIRVIVTTNFDQLLEAALDAESTAFTVISTPDAAQGVMPFQHENCVIIKIHGDYKDTRIKNTVSELTAYDPRMNALLDRVFSDYGLVVCGWSAEWDVALTAALQRSASRRFPLYWASLETPSTAANQLIQLHHGTVVTITGADPFFERLEERVAALEAYQRPHPVSAAAATATVERYLENKNKIRLRNFVRDEVEKVYEAVKGLPLATTWAAADYNADYRMRLDALTDMASIVTAIMATGYYWGDAEDQYLWIELLERLTYFPRTVSGTINKDAAMLQLYPALLAFYAGGIASLAANRLDTFVTLLHKPTVRDQNDREKIAVLGLATWNVIDSHREKMLLNSAYQTASSQWLHDALRPRLQGLIPAADKYTRLFDRFEYLVNLEFIHQSRLIDSQWQITAPLGCFAWRHHDDPSQQIMSQVLAEFHRTAPNWPLLKAGLIGDNQDRALQLLPEFNTYLTAIH